MHYSSNSSQFMSSSRSFSMLPSVPKIFNGRDTELNAVVSMLCKETPRIAILGAGGMGKTSLAKAALHHPDVVSKYTTRFFVPCDSATNSIEMAALVGSYIGLQPAKDLTKPVLQYFGSRPASLLILDNLETTWEPLDSRGSVEEFLSLLTDISDLALMVSALQYSKMYLLIPYRSQCEVPSDLPKFTGLIPFCHL